MKVVSPWSSEDAKGLLKSAIRDLILLYFLKMKLCMANHSVVQMNSDDFLLPIGKAHIEREGIDVTIIAFSIMVGKAIKSC